MANKQRCWLFTEIEDEKRITQGNAGYDDETGVIYRYDNSVPNHKNPVEGDVVVLRMGDEVLGSAVIFEIKSKDGKRRDADALIAEGQKCGLERQCHLHGDAWIAELILMNHT